MPSARPLRRRRTSPPLVAFIVVVIVASACGGDDRAFNPVRDLDLDETVSFELELPGGEDADLQLVTVTDASAVDDMVEALDEDLELEGSSCEPEMTLRLFGSDGTATEIGFRCDGEPWLTGSQDAWDGRRARPSEGAVQELESLLALLP